MKWGHRIQAETCRQELTKWSRTRVPGQKALCTQRSECAWLLPQRALAPGELGSRRLKSFHLLLFSSPLLPGTTKPDDSDVGQRSLGACESLLLML